MSWLDDLKTIGVAAGIPTASIFKSANAQIPAGAGPFTSLISTGGTGPERTQDKTGDAYRRPSAQIMARGDSYVDTVAQLQLFYNAITLVQNQLINGTWYVDIRPLQSDFIDLNPEEGTGRARVAFNVLGDRRP